MMSTRILTLIMMSVVTFSLIACGDEGETEKSVPASSPLPAKTPTMQPGVNGVSTSAASTTPTATLTLPPALPCEGNEESDKPCEPRDVSSSGLHGYSLSAPTDTPTVEEVLEKGLELSGASPVHLAFRGTAQSDTVRCIWRGVARTLEQREEAIRYWLGIDEDQALPSPAEVERQFMDIVNDMAPRGQAIMEINAKGVARGGFTPEVMFMTCFVDYTVNEFLLGPDMVNQITLTVAYEDLAEAFAYSLYKRSHEGGRFGDDPLTPRGQYETNMTDTLSYMETAIIDTIGGREAVVFLAPLGAYSAIAVETWRVIEQWDLQEDDQGTVHAVRYGIFEGDPEQTQTLANLRSPITAAATTDAHADDRIENAGGLTQYYRDIGAYGDITPGDGSTATFTPSQPPAVTPAPIARQ